MKTVCFTGGGSSGHVTPNLAIIKQLKNDNINVIYIGSYQGIEKELINQENIPYFAINSGKLRRYFSWKNFVDPFKILLGTAQAYFKLNKMKPAVIFSKGGFVSFPVAVAAKLNNIPLVVHESDFIPGLANKLVFPLAEKICLTFEATQKVIKQKEKIIITGAPSRNDFFSAAKEKALKIFNLDPAKKTILVMGGGLGSVIINKTIIESLPALADFNIIHLTGKGKLTKLNQTFPNYFQEEYLSNELFDIMALADLVISRAGSNSLYELMVLKKKNILIPLSKKASRGDQIDNAKFFETQKLSYVIAEEELTSNKLINTITEVFQDSNYDERLVGYQCMNGTEEIVKILQRYL